MRFLWALAAMIPLVQPATLTLYPKQLQRDDAEIAMGASADVKLYRTAGGLATDAEFRAASLGLVGTSAFEVDSAGNVVASAVTVGGISVVEQLIALENAVNVLRGASTQWSFAILSGVQAVVLEEIEVWFDGVKQVNAVISDAPGSASGTQGTGTIGGVSVETQNYLGNLGYQEARAFDGLFPANGNIYGPNGPWSGANGDYSGTQTDGNGRPAEMCNLVFAEPVVITGVTMYYARSATYASGIWALDEFALMAYIGGEWVEVHHAIGFDIVAAGTAGVTFSW